MKNLTFPCASNITTEIFRKSRVLNGISIQLNFYSSLVKNFRVKKLGLNDSIFSQSK